MVLKIKQKKALSTALLRCNSYAMQLRLKYTIQWFLLHSQMWATITTVNCRIFFLKETLYPLALALLSSHPWFSVSVDFSILDFCMNGII